MRRLLVLSVYVLLIGCGFMDNSVNAKNDDIVDALIISGSESPDPVLKRVQELESNGVVKML